MRYYFDIFEDDYWARDDVGVDCESDRRARYQAVLALTELARELLPMGGATRHFMIRIRLQEQTAFSLRLDFDSLSGPALTDRSVAH
jgi:hypothetical protein